MIRTTTSKVDLDMNGAGRRPAADVEFYDRPAPYGGKYQYAKLNMTAVAAVREGSTPDRVLHVATINSTPGELRSFCEEALEQLDAAGF
jgi:hypothetical protein